MKLCLYSQKRSIPRHSDGVAAILAGKDNSAIVPERLQSPKSVDFDFGKAVMDQRRLSVIDVRTE
jgi:hypothetical protein